MVNGKQGLALFAPVGYMVHMVTLTELEEQALSLPACLHDADVGLAEAARREAELEGDPSVGMTLGEFKSAFGR